MTNHEQPDITTSHVTVGDILTREFKVELAQTLIKTGILGGITAAVTLVYSLVNGWAGAEKMRYIGIGLVLLVLAVTGYYLNFRHLRIARDRQLKWAEYTFLPIIVTFTGVGAAIGIVQMLRLIMN